MIDTDTVCNVLLVEDLDDDRFFFQYTLKKACPHVNLFTANDGIEAIDYLQNQGRFSDPEAFPRPHIIFLDLKMPGRNGFDVLRWMNEHSLLETIRVFVLSGSSEPQDVALARELGARDYLVKPVGADRLQRILCA